MPKVLALAQNAPSPQTRLALSLSTLRGWMAIAVVFPMLLVFSVHNDLSWTLAAAVVFVALVTSLLFARASWKLPSDPYWSRVTATAAVGGTVALGLFGLWRQPGASFVLLLFAAWALTRIWPATLSPSRSAPEHPVATARSAARASLVLWLIGVLPEQLLDTATLMLLGAAPLGALALGLRTVRTRPVRPLFGLAVLAATLLVTVGHDYPALWLTALQLPVVVIAGMPLTDRPADRAARRLSWVSSIAAHPARFMVATFAVVGLVGGMVLSLPISSADLVEINPLDAFFTSMSAVCVTGLAVLDTPGDFSRFGQAVILALIQVGGLGIMTFSTGFMVLLGRRLSVRQEEATAGLLGAQGVSDIPSTMRRVLVVTLLAEGMGTATLSLWFRSQGQAWETAVWNGLFTAVSAFCNAGFALQSNSLIPYQQHPVVLHVVSLLIIVGGLGPVVVAALPAFVRGRRTTLHTRVVLITSAALLVVPALLVTFLEWQHALAHLSVMDRLHNAWFQSVTTRTAGFNAIDLTQLRPATTLLIMALMFIGGAPGSTAGGVKVTTLALLLVAVTTTIQGRSEGVVGGRRLPQVTIQRATAIATMGMGTVLTALFALMLTQELSFESAFFEVVSALGTVGLTLGATSTLDDVGKVLIMVCMLVGRVGPLSLFLLLSDRKEATVPGYPKEDVQVG